MKPITPDKKYHSRYFHFLHALDALKNMKGTALDVGSGMGGLTAALQEANPNLIFTGCDNDRLALTKGKAVYERQGIKTVVCDAHKLSFQDGSFDAVVMFDVLEHLSRPQKVLEEIHKVLKKDGVFHLVVPCEAELHTIDGLVKKYFKKNLKEIPIGHIQQFTVRDIKKYIEAAGFSIKEIRYSYYFFYQLISVLYFLYLSIFRGGRYLSLDKRNTRGGQFITILTIIVGWMIFVESFLFQFLPGQTVHITMKKV